MTRTDAACGSCSAWLMRSAATRCRLGGGVGEDGDLGGACLGIDAHHTLDQALGSGHEDVAGPRHHIHGLQGGSGLRRLNAVGERGDGLRAADGVHLGDAQQGGGGKDGGVRQAAELLLRRRRQGDRFHAGGQCGDHVHDDRRRVDGQAAGNVEAHACHRNPVLADHGAVAEFDVDVAGTLAVGEDAGTAIDSSSACRTSGSSSARAASSASCGHPAGADCSTPSNGARSSARAANPSARTAAMMSWTFSSASATVWPCARGTAARSPASVRSGPGGPRSGRSTAEVAGAAGNSEEMVTRLFYGAPRRLLPAASSAGSRPGLPGQAARRVPGQIRRWRWLPARGAAPARRGAKTPGWHSRTVSAAVPPQRAGQHARLPGKDAAEATPLPGPAPRQPAGRRRRLPARNAATRQPARSIRPASVRSRGSHASGVGAGSRERGPG